MLEFRPFVESKNGYAVYNFLVLFQDVWLISNIILLWIYGGI